ncbi:MAG: hypothetical protein ACMUIG_00735 [Thermoplasmatota archaeon]
MGDGSLDPAYLKNRGVFRISTGYDRIAVLLKVRPPLLGDELIHWGPPSDNPRADDFRRKWSEHHRVYHEKGRLYVRLKRDVRDPGRLLAGIWDEMRHGPAFRGSALIPAGEKEIFDTDITHSVVGNGAE